MVVTLRQLLAGILSITLAAPALPETHDAVGNRTQKTSTIAGFPGGLTNYNANDQLATDMYDNNGNTTASNGLGYAYDFENHVIQGGGGITMVYDGDGNRVQKTVAGVTTKYLVDTQNPTGYAQVVNETFSGGTGARELSHSYVYGLELIEQARQYFTGTQTLTQYIYYVFDGHGSVRALTDTSGNVTDTYDYDAFGNLLHSTGATFNEFLFAGEQFDPDLNLYYNRARYLNVSTGRFWSMDSFEGDEDDPPSLHKYTYTQNDPVNGHDATGFQTEVEEVTAEAVDEVISSIEQQLRYDRILRFVRVATTGITLLTIATTLDGDNSPAPGNRDRTKKPKMLYRFGFDWEFASDLETQAQAAEANGFPHGVSTFSKRPSTRTDVEEAPFDVVAGQFPVEKTGVNPFHYTVVLPSPVTEDAATRFNRLWFPPRVQPQ